MKKNRTYYSINLVVMLFVVLCLTGFDQMNEEVQVNEEITLTPLMKRELQDKFDRYQKTLLDKCRKKAIEAAEIYIDSLVAEEIKFQASDTLKFPAKPIRPELLKPIILNDSTVIAPIFKKDTAQ